LKIQQDKSTMKSVFRNNFIYINILIILLITGCGTETTPTYQLTTSVVGNGTVSPSSGQFDEGESVTITSTPDSGWVFSNWEGDLTSSQTPATITMDSDKNIIGVFERKEYTLNITIEGEGSVSERIVSQPKVTDYLFETVIELTASPSTDWEFIEWSGDVSSQDSIIQISINQEKSITAKFKENTFFLNDNGVTIMCPESNVGDKGIVNGVEYESVDNELLVKRRNEGADLSKVCTSHVTRLSNFFTKTTIQPDIDSWDVSNVTTMTSIFLLSEFNQPIGSWDVSNMTDMEGLFSGSKFNQDISNWDVSNVTTMRYMFQDSDFNQDISNWDVSSVTNMNYMFTQSDFNQDISNWDVSSVTNMDGMFSQSKFNQPIGNWNVSSVTNMGHMFTQSEFNQPIGSWNVSNVTYMRYMFRNSDFNQPIGNWNVSSVTNMGYMFESSQFNQDISNWCVSLISSEPSSFSRNAPLTEENKPKWGTCPSN
jgi:surface protein